jgi:hypothetical protein
VDRFLSCVFLKNFMSENKKRVPAEKERVLNPIVERHRLCGPSSVGQVTDLILSNNFKEKSEWEEFYLNSGGKRKKLIEEQSKKMKKTALKKFISSINKHHGRTEEELKEKGKKLFEWIPEEIDRLNKSLNVLGKIDLNDCEECIKQYVIDNTWEGIIKTENAVVEKLKKIGVKKITKTEGDIDTKMGIDREIFSENEDRKIGIQIKPSNSRGTPLIDVHNKNAQSKYNGKVITIYSDKKGKFKNEEEVIKEIKDYLNIF